MLTQGLHMKRMFRRIALAANLRYAAIYTPR